MSSWKPSTEQYAARTRAKTAKAEVAISCRLHAVEKRAGPPTRLQEELPLYEQLINKAVNGAAITARTYLSLINAESRPFESSNHWYTYVVCTMQEATELLRRGPPQTYVVVLPDPNNPPRTLSLDKYIDFLRSKEAIDTHTWDHKITEKDYIQPKALDPEAAIRSFHRHETNWLNLDIYKQNPVPTCFEDEPAYNILQCAYDVYNSGKRLQRVTSDLSYCAAFQICASAGVFSFPHQDHCGVITTTFTDEGEKLWLCGRHLAPEEKAHALDRSNWNDFEFLFPIHLKQGEMLIQPAGRLHAPYSMTAVLMTGTMHWHSAHMLSVVRQAAEERDDDSVSNEQEADETETKLRYILKLWREDCPAWPWGSRKDLREAERLVEDLFGRYSHSVG